MSRDVTRMSAHFPERETTHSNQRLCQILTRYPSHSVVLKAPIARNNLSFLDVPVLRAAQKQDKREMDHAKKKTTNKQQQQNLHSKRKHRFHAQVRFCSKNENLAQYLCWLFCSQQRFYEGDGRYPAPPAPEPQRPHSAGVAAPPAGCRSLRCGRPRCISQPENRRLGNRADLRDNSGRTLYQQQLKTFFFFR